LIPDILKEDKMEFLDYIRNNIITGIFLIIVFVIFAFFLTAFTGRSGWLNEREVLELLFGPYWFWWEIPLSVIIILIIFYLKNVKN
jgi:hypothetical protein